MKQVEPFSGLCVPVKNENFPKRRLHVGRSGSSPLPAIVPPHKADDKVVLNGFKLTTSQAVQGMSSARAGVKGYGRVRGEIVSLYYYH